MIYPAYYHRALAAYCGYPQCCVDAWLFACYVGARPPAIVGRGPWEGTGFIPCPRCGELIRMIGFEMFVELIITPRRQVLHPFPELGDDSEVQEVQRRIMDRTL